MHNTRLFPRSSIRPMSLTLIGVLILGLVPHRAEAVWHQQELPGLVSGKSIALLAIVGGGAIAGLFILARHKGANRVALDVQVPRFEEQSRQAQQEQIVGITNRMKVPVSIKDISVESGTSSFSVAAPALPLTVAPGERVAIPVRYTSGGDRKGGLRIVVTSARTRNDVVKTLRLAAR
jgi:hypothetical protein